GFLARRLSSNEEVRVPRLHLPYRRPRRHELGSLYLATPPNFESKPPDQPHRFLDRMTIAAKVTTKRTELGSGTAVTKSEKLSAPVSNMRTPGVEDDAPLLTR